jgi:hypothetical protein
MNKIQLLNSFNPSEENMQGIQKDQDQIKVIKKNNNKLKFSDFLLLLIFTSFVLIIFHIINLIL